MINEESQAGGVVAAAAAAGPALPALRYGCPGQPDCVSDVVRDGMNRRINGGLLETSLLWSDVADARIVVTNGKVSHLNFISKTGVVKQNVSMPAVLSTLGPSVVPGVMFKSETGAFNESRQTPVDWQKVPDRQRRHTTLWSFGAAAASRQMRLGFSSIDLNTGQQPLTKNCLQLEFIENLYKWLARDLLVKFVEKSIPLVPNYKPPRDSADIDLVREFAQKREALDKQKLAQLDKLASGCINYLKRLPRMSRKVYENGTFNDVPKDPNEPSPAAFMVEAYNYAIKKAPRDIAALNQFECAARLEPLRFLIEGLLDDAAGGISPLPTKLEELPLNYLRSLVANADLLSLDRVYLTKSIILECYPDPEMVKKFQAKNADAAPDVCIIDLPFYRKQVLRGPTMAPLTLDQIDALYGSDTDVLSILSFGGRCYQSTPGISAPLNLAGQVMLIGMVPRCGVASSASPEEVDAAVSAALCTSRAPAPQLESAEPPAKRLCAASAEDVVDDFGDDEDGNDSV